MSADAFVVVLSARTFEERREPDWMVWEAQIAFRRSGLPIVPLLIDGASLPKLPIPSEISRLQQLQAIPVSESYRDAAFDRLAKMIRGRGEASGSFASHGLAPARRAPRSVAAIVGLTSLAAIAVVVTAASRADHETSLPTAFARRDDLSTTPSTDAGPPTDDTAQRPTDPAPAPPHDATPLVVTVTTIHEANDAGLVMRRSTEEARPDPARASVDAAVPASRPTPPTAAPGSIPPTSEPTPQDSSERDRIAAVTKLARSRDKAALRPLVEALQDHSATVRGIAASALGTIGHRAALPALRQQQSDADPIVRKRVIEAIHQINIANGLPIAPVTPTTPSSLAVSPASPTSLTQPRLLVVIESSSDDSPGTLDAKTRTRHADTLRHAMATGLAREKLFTSTPSVGTKYGLAARHLALSIVGLELRTVDAFLEVEAQLRLAISDEHGRMLSFVSGGAKIQVPKRGYDSSYLPALRVEAIENAARSLSSKLNDQLRASM